MINTLFGTFLILLIMLLVLVIVAALLFIAILINDIIEQLTRKNVLKKRIFRGEK